MKGSAFTRGTFKVLLVLTPAFQPTAGGVQMSTLKMGRKLAELGNEVRVFSFADAGHAECDFGQLIAAPESGGEQNAGNLGALELELAEFEPEVVINQMPYEHQIGRVLKKGKRCLLLGCLRNTLYSVKGNLESYVARVAPWPVNRLSGLAVIQQCFLFMHRRRHRADLLEILDTYDQFVIFGPPNLEELSYFVPEFPEDKIRLIPNSILQVAEQVPPKEKRLLWLGRVVAHQKRAELILPIWQRVAVQLPDWELDVVGEGPLLDTLRREATERGLERIHFHGRQVPDEYYRRAAVFFMTSAFEGFPNTLVEAQSHGAIPVVFDSYPVARWIVQQGVSGFLTAAFDVNRMADQIIELARSSECNRLAEGALESARRFHIDRVGEMWQELFESEVPRHTQPQCRSAAV